MASMYVGGTDGGVEGGKEHAETVFDYIPVVKDVLGYRTKLVISILLITVILLVIVGAFLLIFNVGGSFSVSVGGIMVLLTGIVIGLCCVIGIGVYGSYLYKSFK